METPIHRTTRIARLLAMSREQALRARGEPPFLLVCGDMTHFRRSALGRIAEGGYFVAVGNQEDALTRRGRLPCLIRWSEDYKFQINSDDIDHSKFGMLINTRRFLNQKDIIQCSFHKIFGYTSAINPLTFKGKGVIKSIFNARHDGRIVQFPIDPSTYDVNSSYEIAIDNYCGEIGEESYIFDIRAVFVSGRIILCYVKFRKEKNRFININEHVEIVMPRDVMTQEEINLCILLLNDLSLDYAEIDILRSLRSGKIYVVDVNDTPFGPPNGLSESEAKVAIRIMGSHIVDAWWH